MVFCLVTQMALPDHVAVESGLLQLLAQQGEIQRKDIGADVRLAIADVRGESTRQKRTARWGTVPIRVLTFEA